MVLPIFETRDHENAVGLSPKFLELMEHAPDRAMFLGDLRSRIFRSGWSGSPADILERRRTMLEPLASLQDPVVRTWIGSFDARLTERIAEEQGRVAEREESFE